MDKVVIFGIDGASPVLVENWRDELSNLNRIMECGVYGELESTIPPITCPAWLCMFTSKNSGKIGIYSFISVETGSKYHIKIHNSLDYHQWSLWKILNDSSISVGHLNVAMIFPWSDDMDGLVFNEIFKPDSEVGSRPSVYQEINEKNKIRDKVEKLRHHRKIGDRE